MQFAVLSRAIRAARTRPPCGWRSVRRAGEDILPGDEHGKIECAAYHLEGLAAMPAGDPPLWDQHRDCRSALRRLWCGAVLAGCPPDAVGSRAVRRLRAQRPFAGSSPAQGWVLRPRCRDCI